MVHDVTDLRTPDGKSPTSLLLLKSPLDFIAEDHLRLRTICAEIDALAEAPMPDDAALSIVTDYLTNELPPLIADEDEGVMPLVLRRAVPDDELPRLTARLQAEHVQIVAHLRFVIDGLTALLPGQPLSQDLRRSLLAFTSVTRRHLILENAVLLPLARARLTAADLVELQNGMLTRRGLGDVLAD